MFQGSWRSLDTEFFNIQYEYCVKNSFWDFKGRELQNIEHLSTIRTVRQVCVWPWACQRNELKRFIAEIEWLNQFEIFRGGNRNRANVLLKKTLRNCELSKFAHNIRSILIGRVYFFSLRDMRALIGATEFSIL